jgi:hypothetical protein
MPLLVGSGGLALLVLAVLLLSGQNKAASAPVEVKGTPAMRVDKELVDLGNLELDKTVQVTFNITNVGDQTLRFIEQPYIEVVEGC